MEIVNTVVKITDASQPLRENLTKLLRINTGLSLTVEYLQSASGGSAAAGSASTGSPPPTRPCPARAYEFLVRKSIVRALNSATFS